MNADVWLQHFVAALDTVDYPSQPWCDEEWTEFAGRVVAAIAEEADCYPAMRRKVVGEDEYSGEYLNIDVMFFDNDSYDESTLRADREPYVLPRVVVELENSYDPTKIDYCIWKLLCVRSKLRVLICYQKDRNAVRSLPGRLAALIRKGQLLMGDSGELLLLIADDSVDEEAPWADYYSAFEWKSGAFRPMSLM